MKKMVFIFSILLALTLEIKAMENTDTAKAIITKTAAIAIADNTKANNTTPSTSCASSLSDSDYSDYPNAQPRQNNFAHKDDINKYPYYAQFPGVNWNPEANR
ncbi:MAG: hypothetical protein JO129_00190 [Candidatus Dependentiae bacterium]|nr:hypothetical protein [Candidatus Dependentiae bacterium]